MNNNFSLQSDRIERKYKRKRLRIDRKFDRRSEKSDRRFKRKTNRINKRIERNERKYERKLASIKKKYIRHRPEKALTAFGVILAVATAIAQWVAFATIDSTSLIEKVEWIQSIINGIIAVPSVVLFSLVLVGAFFISKIPIQFVQNLVSKVSTILFSILMLGVVESTPEMFTTPIAFSFDYLKLMAPIIFLTTGCYFMSYNPTRTFYSSLTDISQSSQINDLTKRIRSTKTETSISKRDFLSTSLAGLDGAANTKTMITIIGASFVASLVQILFISGGKISMTVTCFVLFALPSIMDIVEILARPKESARESLFDAAKDVFTFTVKNIV